MSRTVPAPPESETVARLLNGLVAAIARHGARKVSITDICTEAGVARGTFYRYFSSREDILGALGDYVMVLWRHTIDEAIAAEPDPAHRLRVVHDTGFAFLGEGVAMRRVLRSEAEYALQFVEANWEAVVDLLDSAIRPAFRGRGATKRSRVIADVMARLLLTELLIGDRQSTTPDQFLTMLESQTTT